MRPTYGRHWRNNRASVSRDRALPHRGAPCLLFPEGKSPMSLRFLLTLSGDNARLPVESSLTTGSEGMPPLQARKTGIVTIGRDPFCATLDGKRGQIGIRNEVALGIGLAT